MTKPAFIWIDLETTGLDPRARGAAILEIAVVLTDVKLNEIATFHKVFPLPADLRVAPQVLAMHARSGLIEAIAELPPTKDGGPTQEDDSEIARFLHQHGAKGLPLAGSTVSFDRGWLEVFLPITADIPHYRNVDVSSVKELINRWEPEFAFEQPEVKAHRALDDILVSIEELRHYAQALGLLAPVEGLRSDDYVSGESGWSLEGNGDAEFNDDVTGPSA